jgi:hypothetical protein
MVGHKLVQRTFIRRGGEKGWEKNRFLHRLMVLIPKKPKKFEHDCRVENLDPLARFQLLQHPIDDVQTASKNNVVLNDKLCTSHTVFRAKKNASERPPQLGGFRDVMVRSCTALYQPSLG